MQLPVFIDMLDQENTNVLKLCSATVVFEQLTTSPNGGGLQFFSIFSFYFIDFKRALLRPPKMRVVFSEGVTYFCVVNDPDAPESMITAVYIAMVCYS